MLTKKTILLASLGFIWLVSSCYFGKKTAETATFSRYFPEIAPKDILRFDLTATEGLTKIPDTLIRKTVSSAFYQNLHFDTGDPTFFAESRLAFDKDHDLLILSTEEFWFKKKSGLISDKKSGKVVAIVELANFYGGDGGQIGTETVLFFRQKIPHLIHKYYAQGLRVEENGEGVREYLEENGAEFKWENRQLTKLTDLDSLALLPFFPINE